MYSVGNRANRTLTAVTETESYWNHCDHFARHTNVESLVVQLKETVTIEMSLRRQDD